MGYYLVILVNSRGNDEKRWEKIVWEYFFNFFLEESMKVVFLGEVYLWEVCEIFEVLLKIYF